MFRLFHTPILPFHREGDLRIIRPFVYIREVHLRSFADSAHLPVIAENCPACFEAPKVWTLGRDDVIINVVARSDTE